MAIEIVDFPMNSMVMFHSFLVNVYQAVVLQHPCLMMAQSASLDSGEEPIINQWPSASGQCKNWMLHRKSSELTTLLLQPCVFLLCFCFPQDSLYLRIQRNYNQVPQATSFFTVLGFVTKSSHCNSGKNIIHGFYSDYSYTTLW